jgi:hypothetical protein
VQLLPKLCYTVLCLDVFYAMTTEKKGEKGMTAAELTSLLETFKKLTTAPQFTVILFCSVEQVSFFKEVINNQLNCAAEAGIWYKENNICTNQYTSGFANAFECLLFGFHTSSTTSCTARGQKVDWQKPSRDVQNVFNFKALQANSVCPQSVILLCSTCTLKVLLMSEHMITSCELTQR